jgi:predicted Zn-dependent protease
LICVLSGVHAEAATKRKEIKPGFNLFSKEQDVQLGKEAAAQIEKEVQIVNDNQLTQYIASLGNKLAKHAQDPNYPFTFKVVADGAINAFALPGGPIYMHTGTIAQADNEAQVAGVMAHEIGHVVLRHSTNQASKASLLQLPAVLAGGALEKSGGMLGALGQVGLGLGLNSALLKYSRNAERDADLVGARMMADAGYSPVEMAKFFEKLAAQGGSGGPSFLASHPNPGNRVEYVTAEIRDYSSSTQYVTNTKEFPPMRSRAAGIKPTKQPGSASGGQQQPEVVSGPISGQGYSFQPPKGWSASQHGAGVTVVPSNGVVGQGIARGVIADYFSGGSDQKDAVSKLVADLEAKNPGLKAISGQRRAMRFGGVQGESVLLQGTSPVQGQKENVWLVAAQRPQGLFHLLMIAPESEYKQLSKAYEDVVRSVKFE